MMMVLTAIVIITVWIIFLVGVVLVLVGFDAR